MKKTKIEWCDVTVNPVVGCTFGCPYCYAKKMNDRFKFIKDWEKPQFFPERLKQLNSKKSQNIFMNSMSDVADWGSDAFTQVFKTIKDNPQHNYLFLTKRPVDAVSDFYKYLEGENNQNIWFGITITKEIEMSQAKLSTLAKLKSISGCNVFISFEPLLEYIYWVDLSGIDWIILGAETGNRKNKVVPIYFWIKSLVSCAKNIPVFMKDSLISIVGEHNMLREYPEDYKKGEQ